MTQVFISYSMADRQLADSLAEGLEKQGHRAIIAPTEISIGGDWREEIAEHLRDADAFVVIISKESQSSQWLMAEAGTAMGYFRERGKPLILPIVFDGAGIPAPLGNIQVLFASRTEIGSAVSKLAHALNDLEGMLSARADKKREVQARVEETAAGYIQKSLDGLTKRENNYRRVAHAWYILAYLPLVAGAGFGILRWSSFWDSVLQASGQLHVIVISIALVSLLIALSRLAFLLGKSYMIESLRNADRIHAISFGKFYLEAFGENAEWSEVKEAFQHWNIDTGSSFVGQDAKDYDPELMKNLMSIAKMVTGKKKG